MTGRCKVCKYPGSLVWLWINAEVCSRPGVILSCGEHKTWRSNAETLPGLRLCISDKFLGDAVGPPCLESHRSMLFPGLTEVSFSGTLVALLGLVIFKVSLFTIDFSWEYFLINHFHMNPCLTICFWGSYPKAIETKYIGRWRMLVKTLCDRVYSDRRHTTKFSSLPTFAYAGP